MREVFCGADITSVLGVYNNICSVLTDSIGANPFVQADAHSCLGSSFRSFPPGLMMYRNDLDFFYNCLVLNVMDTNIKYCEPAVMIIPRDY